MEIDTTKAERLARDFVDTGNRVGHPDEELVTWNDLMEDDRAFLLDIFADMAARGVL